MVSKSEIEFGEIKDVLTKACYKAGAYIKSNMGKIKTIEYKSVSNLVTNVDKGSEKIIISIIKNHFPTHSILAEESGKNDMCDSEYRWVIDPVDATTNFAHGFPFFCVSIGLEHNGEIVMGGVYDPIRDELFFAQKNKGAYLNKKRIFVSKRRKIEDSLLATGFSYNPKQRLVNLDFFTSFLKKAQAIRRAGSAALDLCYVACGRFDGFWEIALCPWDTAAGILIIEEANGKVSDFEGNKFSIYGKRIVASNGLIHKSMLDILNSKE